MLYNISMSSNPGNKQTVVSGGAVPILVKAGKANPAAKKNVVAALAKLGFAENGLALNAGFGGGSSGGGMDGNRGRSSTVNF